MVKIMGILYSYRDKCIVRGNPLWSIKLNGERAKVSSLKVMSNVRFKVITEGINC